MFRGGSLVMGESTLTRCAGGGYPGYFNTTQYCNNILCYYFTVLY